MASTAEHEAALSLLDVKNVLVTLCQYIAQQSNEVAATRASVETLAQSITSLSESSVSVDCFSLLVEVFQAEQKRADEQFASAAQELYLIMNHIDALDAAINKVALAEENGCVTVENVTVLFQIPPPDNALRRLNYSLPLYTLDGYVICFAVVYTFAFIVYVIGGLVQHWGVIFVNDDLSVVGEN
ncbi:hypothetical protein GGI20_001937 [Coemansia sp. BCRC 34301]|nr:hypothetical protein GGI20_001937 [Coemansia sp. BCRC 34301]